MKLTTFEDRLRVRRVAWLRIHSRPRNWNRGEVTPDNSPLCLRASCRQVGPYERVWKSDSLIPSHLRDELIAAVSPLENVPDEEKDWHPRSDNQVFNLIHPSLYPVVYNRTFVKDPQTGECEVSQPPDDVRYTISQKFQWLPSDFSVAEDGAVTLVSPYINNIHPQKHAALESVIPKLLERAVPLWERVLSDIRRPLLSFRAGSETDDLLPLCLTEGGEYDLYSNPGYYDEYYANKEAWIEKKDLKLPDAKEKYTGDLDVMKSPTGSLKGTTIQCIIKLANIVLTPEKPEYPGGKWHVEGQWVITPPFFSHDF